MTAIPEKAGRGRRRYTEDETRNVINQCLDAAVACFKERGIAATRMDDVAVQAGMARSKLYRYFRNRDELVISVVEREALSMVGEILPALDRYRNAQNRLVEGMLMALERISASPALSSIVNPRSASAHQVILTTDQLIQIGVDAAQPTIAQALRDGVLRKNLDMQQVSDWILRILISLLTVPSEATATVAKKRSMLKHMLIPAIFETDAVAGKA